MVPPSAAFKQPASPRYNSFAAKDRVRSKSIANGSLSGRVLRGEALAAIEKTESHESIFRDKSVGDTIRNFRESGEFRFGRRRPVTAEIP
jgi:hypothetical protein